MHKHVHLVICFNLFLLSSSFLAFSFSCHSFLLSSTSFFILSCLQQEWNKERIAQMKKQLQRHPGDTGSTPVQSMPDCVCLSYLYTYLFVFLFVLLCIVGVMSVCIEYLKDHMRKNKKVKFLRVSKKVLEAGIVLASYTVSGAIRVFIITTICYGVQCLIHSLHRLFVTHHTESFHHVQLVFSQRFHY